MTAKSGMSRDFQGGKSIRPGGVYWMRYVIPALVFYVIFMAYPMLDSIRLSLYEGTAGVRTYVGLANYVRLFTDEVLSKRFWNAFLMAFLAVRTFFTLLTATRSRYAGPLRVARSSQMRMGIPCVFASRPYGEVWVT